MFYHNKTYFAWAIAYLNFKKNLFNDFVPPGFYLLSAGLHLLLKHGSLAFWQKVIDLLAGELIIVFFSLKTISHKKWWLVPVIGFTSVGFLSPLVAQGGEGPVALLIILGLYYWQEKKFIKASLFFSLSVWFKFLFYFIAPALFIFSFFYWQKLTFKLKRQLLLGTFIILLSIVLYQLLDNFQDLTFQFNRQGIPQLEVISLYFGWYLFTLILGFPFLLIANRNYKLNLFFYCGLVVWIILAIYRYCYYYAFPIFALFFASVFYKNTAYLKINVGKIFLTVLFGISVFFILPYLTPPDATLPIKKEEYQKVIKIISANYQGGFVVIPMSFALEFPYKNYSHDGLPKDKNMLRQIEWIVARPDIPEKLTAIKECQAIYQENISSLISLYRYQCH